MHVRLTVDIPEALIEGNKKRAYENGGEAQPPQG
jgi:hypothetical protein